VYCTVLTVLSDMDSETNTASMDTADNISRRLKRSNKENIEPLAAGPLKRVKTASAVDAEMVRCDSSASFINEFICNLLALEANCHQRATSRSYRQRVQN